jgi:hypothetical protein
MLVRQNTRLEVVHGPLQTTLVAGQPKGMEKTFTLWFVKPVWVTRELDQPSRAVPVKDAAAAFACMASLAIDNLVDRTN